MEYEYYEECSACMEFYGMACQGHQVPEIVEQPVEEEAFFACVRCEQLFPKAQLDAWGHCGCEVQ